MDLHEKHFNRIRYASSKKSKNTANRKSIKKCLSKEKLKPSKRQKGGRDQPYYYLPVTKGGQLILKGIELDHIRQFLVCLMYSSKLQEWMLLQKKRITLYASGNMFSERIKPFFHAELQIQNLSKQLDKDVIDFAMTFLQSLWHNDSGHTTRVPVKSLSVPITIKGGQNDNTLRKVVRTVFAAITLHSTVSNPRRTVQVKDTDNRRTIVGIVFPDIGLRCIAKCSNNEEYIIGYRQEAKVYSYFESKKEKSVCPFYGGVSGKAKRDRINANNISISIPIPSVNTSALISIPRKQFGEENTPISAPVYSLITDWDESYCTLEEALESNIPPTLRNRHLKNVMEVTGYLNNKYKFFHGDLKNDNIMVKKDGSAVRCFDFDWSGIVKLVPNDTVLSYFEVDECKDIIHKFINEPSAKGLCFLLVLDAYRLFVSWIWDLSKTKRFDVFTKKCNDDSCVNSIEIKNRYISFTIQDFVDFLVQIADTKNTEKRTIDHVMFNIFKTREYNIPSELRSDWNATLMHEKVIWKVFLFIMARAKTSKQRSCVGPGRCHKKRRIK